MQYQTGNVVKGKVTKITGFGAFVSVEGGGVGMIHISEISSEFVKDIRDHLSEGQEVEAVIISIDAGGRLGLSIRKNIRKSGSTQAPVDYFASGKQSGDQDFEDMMHKFKTISDDKLVDLKRGYDAKRGSSKKNHH